MKARVWLHDALVGHLELFGDLTAFRFTAEYLDMAERPVLGRWFEDRLGIEVVTKRSQSALPPFFQNVLPEPGGALRTLLARRADVAENRELGLLAALGADLPGAMVVELASGDLDDDALDRHGEPPVGGRDDVAGGPLRFSLAGMQLKLSVLLRDEKLTLPASGEGGRFILKLPTSLPRVPENEHVVMTWASRAGLDVAPVRLASLHEVVNLPPELVFAEEKALVVERFDRSASGGPRIHQEDFAQVFGIPPTDKYGREAGVTFDRMGRVIAAIAGRDDFDEFLRRLVFCVLCRNPDAHLKNWSLWYPDRRRPRLSPAYDLVSASVYPHVEARLACRLAGVWEIGEVRLHHFGVLAQRAGFSAADGVAVAEETATRARAAWQEVSSELDVPAELHAALDAHLAATSLPRRRRPMDTTEEVSWRGAAGSARFRQDGRRDAARPPAAPVRPERPRAFPCALARRISARKRPVWEPFTRATSSGVPAQTTRPPPAPPSGPMSTIQSAHFTTSRLCSMTTTVLPPSTRRCKTTRRRWMSSKCRPVVGSSRT
ncbi:MAG: HipA domain-containing protein [Labilithrix sp.]|nr:HipA domain-containing protein [Labilithrix sp.]MBX3211267.1 HipA domain-containing protein [Labilithrix sp.]